MTHRFFKQMMSLTAAFTMSLDKSEERILVNSGAMKHFLDPSWNSFKVQQKWHHFVQLDLSTNDDWKLFSGYLRLHRLLHDRRSIQTPQEYHRRNLIRQSLLLLLFWPNILTCKIPVRVKKSFKILKKIPSVSLLVFPGDHKTREDQSFNQMFRRRFSYMFTRSS